LRIAALLVATIVVPFVFSRVASPWGRVSVYTIADVPSAEAPPQSGRLRVVCFNIAHGRGLAESNWQGGDHAERAARLNEIAELLSQIDSDVVVLNEVDFDSSWSHSVDQARYLAEKAGYRYVAEQRNLDFRVLFWTWRFGNAVLSKYPIENARVVDLPGFSTWETVLAGKKRALRCDVVVGDQTIGVVATHLSHRKEALRVRSATVLIDHVAASTAPTIVAGDLNSTPPDWPESRTDRAGRNAIKTIDSAGYFRRLPDTLNVENRDLTFRADDPYCVIDWILIPRAWRFVKYRVEASILSDHRPVIADVEFEVARRRQALSR
jgi:endonuclease/exonuclease/phosphatase family metal-dependent hydrolase